MIKDEFLQSKGYNVYRIKYKPKESLVEKLKTFINDLNIGP